MKYMGLNELREAFLSYFESKGHLRLPSFPLVPKNDKSLLLINSGMAPMKKFFTGEVIPPSTRVCTCQKCIRTPDLERVGHTARHGTFFEMLGNFSFGDYFKNEAIPYAWEFLTKVLEIPEEKLWPSIYENDDEAFEIWHNVIGVPEERIVRLGKADNFWEHGSGPCGPCSEIYFDRGEKYGCGSPDCKPGCDCDRYMEIWNNVFSQFDNDGNGNYTELKQKNIDTGMGLERLACIMQGVDNMFEVDTVRRTLDEVCKISGKVYGDNAEDDISIRIITDHIRSASFMISDGVVPSNEGRGYVLRRIIRRAARHGRLLGIKGSFLTKLLDVVVNENKMGYPELGEKSQYIKKVIDIEEERFGATIDSGLSILNSVIAQAKKEGKKVISGEDAFKLYDTFGFPVDLTNEIAEESGLLIDKEKFGELMQAQRERARKARANISGWDDTTKTFLASLPKTEFLGYDSVSVRGKVICIVAGDEKTDLASEGEVTVILDKTSFYGEGGGQVGDVGFLVTENASFPVIDTKKSDGIFMHIVKIEDGILKVGDEVLANVDSVRRKAIARNHSAAHLLQAALREVLGNHVEQAGSYVDAEKVRFDFKHFEAMTKEEIEKVESIVNFKILEALPVHTDITDVETARAHGATALFDEKYGDKVRFVQMGDFSKELCGGTHLNNTAEAGLFKIVEESAVAAGIRRIQGVTGQGVLALLNNNIAKIASVSATLKCTPALLEEKANAVISEIKAEKAKVSELTDKLSLFAIDSILSSKTEKNGFDLIFRECEGDLRSIGDLIKEKNENAVAVLYTVQSGKVVLLAVCGKNAVKNGANAGNILKTISPIVGGGGGGRPDSAQSGGKSPEKIGDAEKAFYNLF